MSTIRMLLRATAVVVGLSAALVVGGLVGTAHADPAQPAPAPNIGQQLVSTAANAPQMLQNLATALGATPPAPLAPPPLASAAIRMPQSAAAAVPGAPAVIPGVTSGIPGATSAIPGATAAVPGITSAIPGATPGLPGITSGVPAATAGLPGITSTVPGATAGLPGITSTVPGATAAGPASGPAQLVPSAQLHLPTLPFLPVPLPQQASFPGDLISLASGGMPTARAGTQPSTPVASTPVAAPATSPNALLLPLSGLP
jgi:hypothetical protein